jgi:proteasome lid subunit RPN8/RPN11
MLKVLTTLSLIFSFIMVIAIMSGSIIWYDENEGIIVTSLNSSPAYIVLGVNVTKMLYDNYTIDGNEYAACIGGDTEYINDTIFNLITINNMFEGDTDHVMSVCHNDSIAHIHSHTNGSCRASNADIISWQSFAKHGVVLFIIQCSNDTIMLYTQEDYSRGYKMKYNTEGII